MSAFDDDRGLDAGGGGDPRDGLDGAGGETPESLAERAQHAIADQQARADYLEVFGTPAGLRVLKDLRERFVDPPGYLPGRPDLDQVHSVYRDGQRSVIREIHQQLNIDRKRKR